LPGRVRQASDHRDRSGADFLHCRGIGSACPRSADARNGTLSGTTFYGLCCAVLVGAGLYGTIVQPHPLRKIIAFNIIGSGTFLLFGVVARRGAGAGMGSDPVPQAMVITGLVVAFSATALAVALLLRLSSETVRDADGQPPQTNDETAGC